jgi:hypothetical protein
MVGGVMMTLTPRERVLRAVSRQKPDKVPKDTSWGFTPAVMEKFKQKTGCDDPEEYFGVEVRFVGLRTGKNITPQIDSLRFTLM